VPPRDWRLRIEDMLDAVGAIEEYVEGMDFEAFQNDRKTVDAVVRKPRGSGGGGALRSWGRP